MYATKELLTKLLTINLLLMKKYISLFCIGLFVLFYSCKKEDELTPSYAEIDYFMPQDNQTDEVSQLRRQFYEDTQVKLLFTDSLYVTEQDTVLVDVEFNYVVNYSGIDYTLDRYQNYADMQAAADFVQDRILSRIGNITPPYSVLLLNNFISEELEYGFPIQNEVSSLVSLKTTVINTGDIASKSEEEKDALSDAVLSEFLANRLLSNHSEELKPFFDVSADIYDDIWNSFPTYTETDQINGFIEAPPMESYLSFTRAYDLENYLYNMLTYSEEELKTTYGAYDRIVTKLDLLKDILKEQFEIDIY